MPTFPSFKAFGAEMAKMGKELENAQKRKITRDMAERAQKIATAAASADLGGDPKFSGWAPPLDTQIKATRNNGALLAPTRSSAGPWTVAERGRNQGDAAGFAGPGINTRTGLTSRTKSGGIRKVRSRKAKRWNGRTKGKHTASTAQAAMERELPKIAEDGIRRVMRKHFDVT